MECHPSSSTASVDVFLSLSLEHLSPYRFFHLSLLSNTVRLSHSRTVCTHSLSLYTPLPLRRPTHSSSLQRHAASSLSVCSSRRRLSCVRRRRCVSVCAALALFFRRLYCILHTSLFRFYPHPQTPLTCTLLITCSHPRSSQHVLICLCDGLYSTATLSIFSFCIDLRCKRLVYFSEFADKHANTTNT